MTLSDTQASGRDQLAHLWLGLCRRSRRRQRETREAPQQRRRQSPRRASRTHPPRGLSHRPPASCCLPRRTRALSPSAGEHLSIQSVQGSAGTLFGCCDASTWPLVVQQDCELITAAQRNWSCCLQLKQHGRHVTERGSGAQAKEPAWHTEDAAAAEATPSPQEEHAQAAAGLAVGHPGVLSGGGFWGLGALLWLGPCARLEVAAPALRRQ